MQESLAPENKRNNKTIGRIIRNCNQWTIILLPEHGSELLGDPFEDLLDGGGVANEGGRHAQATWWDVANSGLNIVRNPLHKVAKNDIEIFVLLWWRDYPKAIVMITLNFYFELKAFARPPPSSTSCLWKWRPLSGNGHGEGHRQPSYSAKKITCIHVIILFIFFTFNLKVGLKEKNLDYSVNLNHICVWRCLQITHNTTKYTLTLMNGVKCLSSSLMAPVFSNNFNIL